MPGIVLALYTYLTRTITSRGSGGFARTMSSGTSHINYRCDCSSPRFSFPHLTKVPQ